MQKLMYCTMCTASIRLAQCTAVLYMHALYSVSERRYTTRTVLLHSSTCRFYISRSHIQLHAMPYFFTCVSFVLYLKFIYQLYYGLILYLSLNESLNLKSPITCKTTQQIIKKELKKETTNGNNK